MNRFAITLASATALAAAFIAAAPVGAHADELTQIGDQHYRITGHSGENANMASAQRFCRAKGYGWAELEYTSKGSFIWEPDQTNFFCLNSGQYTYPLHPSIDVNID